MALSKLCKIVRLSPNCTRPRNHAVDRLTYHHMAGKMTAQSCLDMFAQPSRQASCHYPIGYDGTIGGCVDENDRPWTSSSRENDNRAITFELSNSAVGGNWPVSDATIKAAIDLTVDICKRHGKTKVLWFGDKAKTLSYEPKKNEMVVTLHRWFANTNCPGEYLESKIPYIVNQVNKRLNAENTTKEEEEMVRYKTVKEMPEYIQPYVTKLIELGHIRGRSKDNLDITEDMARVAIWNARMQGVDFGEGK